MITVLLVDDEKLITESLGEYLNNEGFSTICASGEKEGIEALKNTRIDIALIDIQLGKGSGFEVCRLAREMKKPVIFLTASDDDSTTVKGLDMGADDYVVKPFSPRVLLSRINSVLRRYEGSMNVVAIGDITVDMESAVVKKGGKEVILSALEYRLLVLLINNRGRLLTRNMILEDIWDVAGDFVNDNTLTVYIKRLREKIEADPQNPEIIRTVRGLGYKVE